MTSSCRIAILNITPLLTASLHAMLFRLLFPCLLALALVDEVVRLDEGSLCNLTTVGRRWFDARDVKADGQIKADKVP